MINKSPNNIKELKEILKNPPVDYSVAPFWFLNGDLNDKELLRQLKEIYSKGIREFFIHPRFGLGITYLSDKWHEKINIILKKARELNMKVWIYDELDWPSGYAGGKVIKSNTDFRAKNLFFFYKKIKGPKEVEISIPEGKLIGIFKVQEKNGIIDRSSVEDIFDIVHKRKDYSFLNSQKILKDKSKLIDNTKKRLLVNLPTGNWVILFFVQRYCSWRNLYQKEPYIDVLSEKAVSKFIELTHKQYYKHHKEYFTNTIVGFYCDEPGMYTNILGVDSNSIPWTNDLPQFFKQEKGYNLIPKLFSIWMDIPNMSDKVRYDYYDIISHMYKQNYFGQISSWCKKHNVKFSGHLLLEENLFDTIKSQGNLFEPLKLLDIPGVDIVQDIDESKSLTPKIASSIAHFKGKERSSCETFGIFGWDLTFEKIKYVTNWLCVRGINMIIPHALYYSTEGERKNDCPPSLFFQNPIWKNFEEYVRYTKTLCYMLSLGNHDANIALYYPIVSGWTNIRPDNNKNNIDINNNSENNIFKIDSLYKKLGNLLFKNQWDFDILDDQLINNSFVSDEGYLFSKKGSYKSKKEIYKILIIPYSPTIPLYTLEKIYEFCEKGGLVIFPDGKTKKTLYHNNEYVIAESDKHHYSYNNAINICNSDSDISNDNNKKEVEFLLLKEKLFKKSKFKNYGFFQNKINKGICFFRDEDIDKDIKDMDIFNKDSISFEKSKEDLKSKKLSALLCNNLKKSPLFNKLLKIKITKSFLQLIYKAYKTLNKTTEIRNKDLEELNSEYEIFEKLKNYNLLQLLNRIMKRKIWLSGDSQEVTMLQRDLDFCKILFLLSESNILSKLKININIQTIPLICNLENGELIKIKNFKCKNELTEIPINLNKEESILLVLPSTKNQS